MIIPDGMYHIVGRDAYDYIREWQEEEQKRMDAVLAERARQIEEEERLRHLPEIVDE